MFRRRRQDLSPLFSVVAHSSIEMACSGHECTASRTASSWSGGTTSFTGDEVPSMSLSSNESGAIIEHSVWPWQRSGVDKNLHCLILR